MLESSLFESGSANRTKKSWTLPVSIALHTSALAILVLLPLVRTLALSNTEVSPRPAPLLVRDSIDIVPPITTEPRIVRIPEVSPTDLIAPLFIPDHVAIVIEPPAPTAVSAGPSDRGIGSLISTVAAAETVLPPPLPPTPPPTPVEIAAPAQ